MVLTRVHILRLVLRELGLSRGEPTHVATSVCGTHGVHPALAGGPLVSAGHHGTRLALADVALALLLDLLRCRGEAIGAGYWRGVYSLSCMAVVVIRMTTDLRIRTMPGRSTSGFHRPGRHG